MRFLPSSRTGQLGTISGIALVVANMIGTGIFTTPGLIIQKLEHPVVAILIWAVGGIIALCGALTYAELGTAMPRSGGEYHYLSQLYYPALGFFSGWLSLFVGFSAPIAASGVAFGQYMQAVFQDIPVLAFTVPVIVGFTVLHLLHVRWGSHIQNALTILKVVFITVLIVMGFYYSPPDALQRLRLEGQMIPGLTDPAFAVSLIFVMYAYSGWNAAAYLTEEFQNPRKTLPLSLIVGALIVIVLYAGLNILYVTATPPAAVSGEVEIAHYTARHLFGETAGQWVSLLIGFVLLSSISAMIMAGPRVYEALGEDHRFFRWLAQKGPQQTPLTALLLQMIIALTLALTFTFEAILYYAGFMLSLFAGLTVFGVFIKRRNEERYPESYKTWGYPVTPILFLLVSGWVVVHTFIEQPVEALMGLLTLGIGGLLYYSFPHLHS